MSRTDQTVCVLIPYFQRTAGVLEKTVRSVLTQKCFDDFEIIIVDDGSPVSADDELSHFSEGLEKIRVIRQVNAGPGAARNKALDNVREGVRYIAFLDSDDAMEETYLADGVHALSLGYDLFFANSKRSGLEKTRFDWTPESGVTLEVHSHQLVDRERELYEFCGDFFDFIVRRSNIMGQSTMMFRSELASNVRYKENVYNGQDRIFKLSLGAMVDKVAFSPRVYTQEGKGVNIFDSAGWGSTRSLSLLSSYIDMSKIILREISLTDSQQAHVKQHLDKTRYLFTAALLHQLNHRSPIDWRSLRHTLLNDPLTLIRFLPNSIRVARSKARRS